MSKPWKIALSIGIPIVVIIIAVGLFLEFRERSLSGATGSYDYDYSDGYAVEDSNYGVSFKTARMESAGSPMLSAGVEPAPPAGDYLGNNQNVNSVPTTPTQAPDRLVIKTGNMSMVVENVRAAVGAINNYAIEKGGFVVDSHISKYGLALTGNVTIRIPVEVFDEGLEDVKAMGEVTDERVSGQDVTEEYIDLEAQLKNYRATEAQFLEIMKKAYEIEDILAVQNQLTIVRSNIEHIEGRMKYLSQSAAMSTLTVYLSTDPEVLPAWDEDDKWKPWAIVKNAFRELKDVGEWVGEGLIFVVVFIPLWVLIVLVVWIVVKVIKRIVRGKKNVIKME